MGQEVHVINFFHLTIYEDKNGQQGKPVSVSVSERWKANTEISHTVFKSPRHSPSLHPTHVCCTQLQNFRVDAMWAINVQGFAFGHVECFIFLKGNAYQVRQEEDTVLRLGVLFKDWPLSPFFMHTFDTKNYARGGS